MRALVVLSVCMVAAAAGPLPALADHAAPGFAPGITGPIVTLPARTLPRGSWAASVRVEWVSFERMSDAELADAALAAGDVHVTEALLSPSLALAYGVTDGLTLAARLPHVARYDIREAHLHGGVPELHDHGDSRGLGDLTLLGQLRFVHGHDAGWEAALLAGVKLPTGETEAVGADGERFEADHQPGSGSVDPLLGLAVSRRIGRASVDGDVLAAFATRGSQETRLGTLVSYDLAYSFRPTWGAGGEGLALDLVVEANGEWRGATEIAGAEEESSGGTLLYLAPGLRVGRDGRWSASAALGIPVVQELRGRQHETRLRVLGGLGVAF